MSTQVHKIVLMVVDHDRIGADAVKLALEDARYPNHCIAPTVMGIQTKEVEWSDNCALNQTSLMHQAFARLFICLLFATGLACVADVSTGTSRDHVLIASGPRATEILTMAPALRGLDRRALDCDSLVGSQAGILTCTLLVTCALPLGTDLTFGGITFPGNIGLAPTWATRGITLPQRRAVTSCVLANLSFDGLVGVASIRGPNLETAGPELAGWPVEEGAFFGDLMAARPLAVACTGAGDPASSVRHERLCAQPDPDHPGLTRCGLTLAGGCSWACGQPRGPYYRCRVDRDVFTSVITTFVEP